MWLALEWIRDCISAFGGMVLQATKADLEHCLADSDVKQ